MRLTRGSLRFALFMPNLPTLIRRIFTKRNVMRGVFATALVLTAWITFCLEERWRGNRAWKVYREKALASGTKLTMADFIQPDLPKGQNFAAIPMIDELFSAQESGSKAPVWFTALKLNESDSPKLFDQDGTVTNLQPIRDFFVKSKVVEAASDNAGKDVLAALEKISSELAQLEEAARRADSKFPVKWEKGFSAGLPHLGPLRTAANMVRLRMAAHLATGNNKAAIDDLRFGLRIYRALQKEPCLICGLVRLAIAKAFLGGVVEGIDGSRWSAADLGEIQQQLGDLDFLADGLFALQSERAGMNGVIDDFYSQSDRRLAQTMASVAENAIRPMSIIWYPRGWFRLSQVKLNEAFDTSDRALLKVSRGEPYEPTVVDDSSRSQALIMYRLLMPALSTAQTQYLYSQAKLQQTLAACALERFRQDTQLLPVDLAELVPRYISGVPKDPINAKPMRYRKIDSGGFDLWSIATNRIDDGGKANEVKPAKPVKDQPDWVSHFPSKP